MQLLKKLWQRWFPKSQSGNITLTSGDILVPAAGSTLSAGTKLSAFNLNGELLQSVRVVDRPNATTLTIRSFRWYERLWQWLQIKWTERKALAQFEKERPVRERLYWLRSSQGKKSWTGSRIDNSREIAQLESSLAEPRNDSYLYGHGRSAKSALDDNPKIGPIICDEWPEVIE